MSGKAIGVFLVNSVVATAGSMLGGYLLGFLIALPFGFASSGFGNVADRALDSWFSRHFINLWFPLLPVLTAACLGFLSYRLSKSNSAWLIPAVILLWSVFPLLLRSPDTRKWMYDNYFSPRCGSTECLYQFFLADPFYTSLAYTIGFLAHKMASARTRVS
jgi:hypothetical protein